ncbi:acyl-CoA dehydrogenase FadE [Paraferrimonas haliotis]|uniref:Acyl-coenzyme A dehydrogenase n=1 Tax=Paraferrimonas haliotis TaxID=2013866 RepID=A0AA37U0P7_9GAMM|nr:acyl-CoA dehydrogenase FadE [Paraferrimonas haliotis]GLS84491.1 acyl-CoA dehydrogenase [Paraferrimonas haliotis]
MHTLILTLGVLVIIGSLSYLRVSLMMSTLTVFAFLFATHFVTPVPIGLWVVFAVVAVPLNLSAVRRSLLSKPILKVYRSIMPEMSSTEKEALDAGTTWWESQLFGGEPDWQTLHNYPQPRLTAEEQAFLDGPCEEVCAMVSDFEVNHELADLPEDVWKFIKEKGFFSMIIKKKYGGLEFSAYAQSRVLQKLSGVSAVLSSTVGVPNSLGPGELLQHYGTAEQQNYYLPRLAKGEEVPCFALTSPEAGSDAGAIPDFGVVCHGEWQGEQVLGMKLTWNKRYITLAPVATVLGLAFKLRDPDGLLGDQKEIGITCALIPTTTPGVVIGRRHFPLNTMFQNGPTQGNEVFVPLDYIIGGPKMAGQGWRMLVECLSVGRGITLPSNSAGGAKSIAAATGAYARIRRQFKLPIGKLEGIEEPLARIGGNTYLMDSASALTTTGIDLGEKPSVISAIVKCHLTERLQKVLIDSMDIHGGKGVCLGPNNYVGRGYQGVPISITVEGANILTRNMIIYGQGAIRCHPYVLAEMEAAFLDNEQQAIADFDNALFGHIGFSLSNFSKSVWMGLSSARFTSAPTSDVTKRYYQHLNRFSANLALLSDLAMATLGGDLKRKERISARLGDMLSQLYLASATLKRFEDDGRPEQDLPLLQWAVEDSLYKLQTALESLLENFPVKGLGRTLSWLIMPWGKPVRAPSDKLDHKVARILQTPSETRDRLINGQYFKAIESNPIGIVEQTLHQILAVEPVYDKICKKLGKKVPFIFLDKLAAQGLEIGAINEEEAKQLCEAEVGRLKVINVDDFDPIELQAKQLPKQQHKAA